MEKKYCQTIELTSLRNPRSKEIKKLVKEAISSDYYGVCVPYNCCNMAKAKAGNKIKVVTIQGFPNINLWNFISNTSDRQAKFLLGFYTRSQIKEIRQIMQDDSVDELDIVFPLFWLFEGYRKRIKHFLAGVKKLSNKKVKVIVELGTVIKEEETMQDLVKLLAECKIDLIKTNTGILKQSFEKDLFPKVVNLMGVIGREKSKLKVKVSGGIRTEKQVKDLVDLGVSRIGTSRIN